MILSLTKLGSVAGATKYYAEFDKVDDYYVDNRERPGTIQGKAANSLSLDPQKFKENFHNLLQGKNPETGEDLRKIAKNHNPGWDLTFSADKSYSLVWALAEGQLKKDLEDAFNKAADKGMEYIENNYGFCRTGAQGKHLEKLDGLVWGAVNHDTNRNLEPHVHRHNVLFNIGRRANGKWAALESKIFFKGKMEAGLVSRAEFARNLENLGFRLKLNKKNLFYIVGVPVSLMKATSSRRQEILDAANKFGYSTPAGMEQAALRTRKSKKFISRNIIYKEWKNLCAKHGFIKKKLDFLQNRGTQTNVAGQLMAIAKKKGIDYKLSNRPKNMMRGFMKADKMLAKGLKSLPSSLKFMGLPTKLPLGALTNQGMKAGKSQLQNNKPPKQKLQLNLKQKLTEDN